MESMFQLLTAMAQFAPQVVLNLLDLVVDNADIPGKDEWVARIRKMTGSATQASRRPPRSRRSRPAEAARSSRSSKSTSTPRKAQARRAALQDQRHQRGARCSRTCKALLPRSKPQPPS
jgi:hypothetical protein